MGIYFLLGIESTMKYIMSYASPENAMINTPRGQRIILTDRPSRHMGPQWSAFGVLVDNGVEKLIVAVCTQYEMYCESYDINGCCSFCDFYCLEESISSTIGHHLVCLQSNGE